MNQLLLIGIVIFFSLLFSGCTNSNETTTVTDKNKVIAVSNNPVLEASENYVNLFSSIMNSGYTIVDKKKFYYTQSKDFAKVYFVGTLVKKNDQIYNAIWATNDINSIGMIFSINDYAFQSSGMSDGRTNREPITNHDDGYSRINQKLLDDMMEVVY
ncbi:TPA: hypothetical protein IAA87_05705 [Candidatus Avigastranaerophilus faecigallinarum]|nr:hypothetical protein [Candidatus Avigastranaerophilus faecigallinarum]